jgi:hypothetical protein
VSTAASPPEPSFVARLFLAWVAFFRVIFDGAFAGRVVAVRDAMPALPPPAEPQVVEKIVERTVEKVVEKDAPKTHEAALQLLALLQREGRFVDFLEEDVTSFSDADVGAAARVVHQGCRKALHAHAKVAAVRDEAEGAKVSIAAGTPASLVKLTGDVRGSGPFAGVLRHRGWRVDDLSLPESMPGHDARVVAAAEVEI